MKLYEMTEIFNELFDRFDEINNYIPDIDADGRYIDGNGQIITDLEQYRNNLLSAWFDTLEGIEGEFNEKAENIAAYLKGMYIETAAIKDEESALRRRRQALEKSADKLKAHLMACMQAIGVKKIDMPRARLTIRKNAESVAVDDEIAFINWAQENGKDDLLKYSLPDIRKSETKKALQAGEKLPHARLVRTESLIIK